MHFQDAEFLKKSHYHVFNYGH